MSALPMPADERARLAALRELRLLDSPADHALDELVALAARLLDLPVAAVNLIDADRQWTKAGVGMQLGDQAPREDSLCAIAIASGEDLWVVADLAADPRLADNPFVTGGLGFYAGAPVRTAEGHAIGTLCVAGPQPRAFSVQDRDTLRTLAASVSAHIELARQRALAARRSAELSAVLEQAPDAFVAIDLDGRITEWNAKAHELFGRPRADALGRDLADLVIPPEGRADHRQALARLTAGEAPRLMHRALELPALRADGTLVPVEITLAAVGSVQDGDRRCIAFARDITERREHERERRADADALALLAGVTSRLAAGHDDAVLRDDLCEAAAQIAEADSAVLFGADEDGGLRATGASDPRLRDLRIPAASRSLALEAFTSCVPRFAGDAAAQGWPLAARHGARAVAVQPVLVDGQAAGVLAVFWRTERAALGTRVGRLLPLLAHEGATAIARAALVSELAQQSRLDPLTGVLNRRALDAELRRALHRARVTDQPLSVAVLDLDHFKAYNDSHGHPAGDALLKSCCAAWTGELRGGDVLARFGGEEFVIVLPACARPDAVALLERLRRVMPAARTCSAGVATWDGAEAVEVLLARADRALYDAKGAGRDRVCAAA
ncbi:sensor domain-containing diguanylate cyclase [Baekduia soli]|uniref:Sensor domain-containing diguanylate cyclase n=1 Tax=Baekduia soli TaxID=496014 RepID=A0A5B8U1W3_9ACTN|nr:diguanylate cyclase [Baekduia soli]QEC46940.1 sensor domain-containing diguanylate cyclase [Baekduia soli]